MGIRLAQALDPAAQVAGGQSAPRGILASGWRPAIVHFCRRRTLGAVGGIVLVFMVVLAATASILPLPNPEETSFLDILKPPSAAHLLGTDSFGRDQLSRLIYGARTALLVGITTSLFGTSLGALLGTTGAYFGGRVDNIIERCMDVVLSFPLIILAIAVVAALGNSTADLIVAITIPMIPRAARVVRSSALAIRQMPYIEAARCIGTGHSAIVLRHMLPNVMAPYLILLTAFLGQAILLEASLSFLGLGVAEPTPAWGLMLKNAAQTAERAPWLAIAPGLAISAAVFAANLLGDSLRDALDPRLRTP
jgi:peptide/nickel transport system permease protein